MVIGMLAPGLTAIRAGFQVCGNVKRAKSGFAKGYGDREGGLQRLRHIGFRVGPGQVEQQEIGERAESLEELFVTMTTLTTSRS
jgi:hypothetical protein